MNNTRVVSAPYYKTRSYTNKIDKDFPLTKLYDDEIYRYRMHDIWTTFMDWGEDVIYKLCDISSLDKILYDIHNSKNLFISLINLHKKKLIDLKDDLKDDVQFIITPKYINLGIETDRGCYDFYVKISKDLEKDIDKLFNKFDKNINNIYPVCTIKNVSFELMEKPY